LPRVGDGSRVITGGNRLARGRQLGQGPGEAEAQSANGDRAADCQQQAEQDHAIEKAACRSQNHLAWKLDRDVQPGAIDHRGRWCLRRGHHLGRLEPRPQTRIGIAHKYDGVVTEEPRKQSRGVDFDWTAKDEKS
jgi:hypothetical protein